MFWAKNWDIKLQGLATLRKQNCLKVFDGFGFKLHNRIVSGEREKRVRCNTGLLFIKGG